MIDWHIVKTYFVIRLIEAAVAIAVAIAGMAIFFWLTRGADKIEKAKRPRLISHEEIERDLDEALASIDLPAPEPEKNK